MPVCMQCAEQGAVFANEDETHFICQDCSDLNLTAILHGAAKDGLAVLRMDDTKPPALVEWYVAPLEVS